MKYATLATIGLGLVVATSTAQAQAPTGTAKEGPTFKTMEEKIAYTIGVSIGRNMKRTGIEMNPGLLSEGIRAGMGDKSALTDAQMAEIMQAFQQQMMAKEKDAMAKQGGAPGGGVNAAQAEKNLKDGQAFLADNKAKPGVTTLPSGLQFKVLKEGTGKTPKLADTVIANYRGTLIDGTEFDSSYKRGEPAEFPVGGVIKGWTEVLQKMKVGDKYQVFIPSDLAYGPVQRGQIITPNSTLIFEIELIDVK